MDIPAPEWRPYEGGSHFKGSYVWDFPGYRVVIICFHDELWVDCGGAPDNPFGVSSPGKPVHIIPSDDLIMAMSAAYEYVKQYLER